MTFELNMLGVSNYNEMSPQLTQEYEHLKAWLTEGLPITNCQNIKQMPSLEVMETW